MLRVLEQLGYDLDALLTLAGLRREDVENPDAFISPVACAAVFTAARQQRRVQNLALRIAERTPIGATPLLDYLIVSSDSVGQGLDRLTRYLRLVNPGLRIVVHDKTAPRSRRRGADERDVRNRAHSLSVGRSLHAGNRRRLSSGARELHSRT
jgi:hypothetical protein